MEYQSTRSNYTLDSKSAVLAGIAPDGGLFVHPDIGSLGFDASLAVTLPTLKIMEYVISTLLPDFEDIPSLVSQAFEGKFETPDLTPLVKAGDTYVLELFRGPTSAFKDVALSLLPVLIRHAGARDTVTVLTATSGDTGKAALEGFHDVPGTRIVVFYPHGGVSEIQKAQMVTQQGSNVHVCAVRGNFDNCQTGVKKAFADLSSRGLSSANSINIGRLVPQIVYYFSAYRDLIARGVITFGDKVDFVVPTGNFGDILAGYYALLLGLPVGRLVCASNENKILDDFLKTGVYDKRRPFFRTDSPSMDILVSSNLERLLFLAGGKSTVKVRQWMEALGRDGVFRVDDETLRAIGNVFVSGHATRQMTAEAILQAWEKAGYLCDPHTAVAWHVAQQYKTESQTGNPVIILSTASPYKFPRAVLGALGRDTDTIGEFEMMRILNAMTGVPVPKNLASLEGRPARFDTVIDIGEITPYVESVLNG